MPILRELRAGQRVHREVLPRVRRTTCSVASPIEERKLATILVTDIVGSSAKS
jgi:hypothetical protein